VNGVINCSILDGWWDEGYEPQAGFAVGRRERYASDEPADAVESANLHDLFEDHIVPEFYDRDAAGVPRRWVGRMKRCIQSLAPMFNTNRMVQEYADLFYVNSHNRSMRLAADNMAPARGLASQIDRYRRCWGAVRIESVLAETQRPVPVRAPMAVEAVVCLGELNPDEVSVQIYTGSVAASGDLVNGVAQNMEHAADLGGGRHQFKGEVITQQSGRRGLAVRVIPNDARLHTPFVPGLITWDTQGAAASDPNASRRVQVAAH